MKEISNKDCADILQLLKWITTQKAHDTIMANRIRRSALLIRKIKKSSNVKQRLIQQFIKAFTEWWYSPSIDAQDMINQLTK